MKTKNNNRKIIKPKNIITEFKGFEIEEKFQLVEIPKPSFLAKLKDTLLRDSRFESYMGLESLEWVFDFDYYVFKKQGKINQAFVIVHHSSTPKFWIRKKGALETFPIAGKTFQAWVVKRKETEVLKNKFFLNQDVKQIIRDEERKLGVRPFFLARLTREKYYTFLKNIRTGRVYSLSLDFCYAFDQIISQLEIEYKWRDKKFTFEFEEIDSILKEFQLFSELLLSAQIGSRLTTTRLTKYEWLLKLANEFKNKKKRVN